MRERITSLKSTRLVAVIAAAMLLAMSFGSSARAMVLSLDAGGAAGVIPGDFDLTGSTGLNIGDPITVFNAANPGGIKLDVAGNIEFTFLGSEAAADNAFRVNGVDDIFTQATAIGTSTTIGMAAGLLNFVFTTNNVGGNATNGGPFGAGADLQISFADLGDGSFIALFGDGEGDVDRDDFAVKIAVSAIPLPPAVWLFISAILGLVSFTRIRRAQNTA